MIALEDFATTATAAPRTPQAVWSEGITRQATPRAQAAKAAKTTTRRTQLAGRFRAASDWFSLCHGLRCIGACLKLHQGVLWVCDALSGRPLISSAGLGFDRDDLELRFGPLQPQRQAA